jgi:hypothetical protein
VYNSFIPGFSGQRARPAKASSPEDHLNNYGYHPQAQSRQELVPEARNVFHRRHQVSAAAAHSVLITRFACLNRTTCEVCVATTPPATLQEANSRVCRHAAVVIHLVGAA